MNGEAPLAFRLEGKAVDDGRLIRYSFEPNTNWSKLFSPGAEILEYVKGVAHKYRVDEKIKYNTKWDEEKSLWVVKADASTVNEAVVSATEAEVVISAVNLSNNWKWPEVEGLQDFGGKLLHSAHWDTDWDYTGKTVAVLGCGSSVIQILPHLQTKCPHDT
ncbi:unnamed protein product [Clonostachys rhizophaga]|uniref:Uncharacterized protein n=1 Tax=Clonostachys rhizophaga TaxID=160324 RepID=A0A9N9VR66_9HYPO|nr:unnamed protein product [Clonostachys rhizophaga]